MWPCLAGARGRDERGPESCKVWFRSVAAAHRMFPAVRVHDGAFGFALPFVFGRVVRMRVGVKNGLPRHFTGGR